MISSIPKSNVLAFQKELHKGRRNQPPSPFGSPTPFLVMSPPYYHHLQLRGNWERTLRQYEANAKHTSKDKLKLKKTNYEYTSGINRYFLDSRHKILMMVSLCCQENQSKHAYLGKALGVTGQQMSERCHYCWPVVLLWSFEKDIRSLRKQSWSDVTKL